MPTSPPIYLIAHHRQDKNAKAIAHLPLGIMYVGRALQRAGFKVRLFHLAPGDYDEVLRGVVEEKPLFAGFTTMAGLWLAENIALSRLVHQRGAPVVWGGVYATMAPQLCLADDCVDYVVLGEGEVAAPELARRIRDRVDPSDVPGVGFKKDGAAVISPMAGPLADLDDHRPAWEGLDLQRYFHVQNQGWIKHTDLPVSRGCPFVCSFCHNITNRQQRHTRYHGAEWAKEQIAILKARLPGLNTLGLIGDNPFAVPSKGMELIASLGMHWIAHCRIDMLEPGFNDWLTQTGCQGLFLGVESGSDRVLQILRKHITRDQILAALDNVRPTKIWTMCGYMAYVPGETDEDRRLTRSLIDQIHDLNPFSTQGVGVYQAYPDTSLWNEWLKMGIAPPRDNQGWATAELPALKAFGKSPQWWATEAAFCHVLYGHAKAAGSRVPRPLRPAVRQLWLRGRFGPEVALAVKSARALKRAFRFPGVPQSFV
jgi:radical SAM superfamily enzyme YgiQ (UPF0313 family)